MKAFISRRDFLKAAGITAAAAALAGCSSSGGSASGSSAGSKTIKIGVFEPASGDNGAGGKQEVLGVEYANSLAPTVEIGGETFTVGVLVLTNHGCLRDLTVGGENIGKEIERRIREDTPDEGSCIMIVGTDLPVTSRQLGRIIRRCSVGLARLGSYIGHGSGEVMVGFSTANRIPAQGDCLNFRCIHESHIDDAFRAVAEATEEAVLRSMLEAHPVTGYTGKVRRSLNEFWQP